MRVKILQLFAICLLTPLAWGQSNCHGVNPQMCTHYQVTEQISSLRQTTRCTTQNCFTDINSTNPPSTISGLGSSEFDGTLYSLDSSLNVWGYDDVAHAWTKQIQFGTSMRKIAVGGNMAGYPAIVGLVNTHSGCSANEYPVDYWTGTAWATLGSGCLSDIAIAQAYNITTAPTGVVVGYSLDMNRMYWWNGTSWALFPSNPPGNGPYSSVTEDLKGTVAAVYGGTLYACPSGCTTWSTLGGTNEPSNPAKAWADVWGGWWILDTGGSLWKFDVNTWYKLYFGLSFEDFEPAYNMAIAFHGGIQHLYRYNMAEIDLALNNLTGNTTCTPSNCGTGITHTGVSTVQALAGSIYGGQSNSGQPVPPQNNIGSISAQDGTSDIFDCVYGDLCFSGGTGAQVNCSVVGPIFLAAIGPGGNPPSYNSCFIEADVWTWGAPYSSPTIPVYFSNDTTCGPSGGQKCWTTANINAWFTGTSAWSLATPTNVTYVNKGVWTGQVDSLSSYGAGNRHTVQDVPHGVAAPFIYVTALQLGNNAAGSIRPAAGDHLVTIDVSPSLITNGPLVQLTSTAAHEEGHNQDLDDCCPSQAGCKKQDGSALVNSCKITDPTQTVMWGTTASNQAEFPMPCDYLMSTLNETGLNIFNPFELTAMSNGK